MRRVSMLVALVFSAPLVAQTPPRFQWTAGDVHTFAVEHDTIVTETIPAANGPPQTSVITTKLKLTRTWTVQSVAADGTATLALAITACRNEMTRPVTDANGKPADETTVTDSATPEGAKAMAEYLSKPILTAKVDTRGRVTDVTAKSPESASWMKAELPFRFECPEENSAKWERAFVITLDPPSGTGEKYDAVQTVSAGEAGVMTVATALKAAPTDSTELLPLLPFLWEGTVDFDAKAGRYLGSKLKVKKELNEHQGKGTKFIFESRFEEKRAVK